jgi:hypothetical protein
MPAIEDVEPKCGLARRAIRWLFVSRRNGRITLVQWPNVPLWLFFGLTVAVHVTHVSGRAGTVIRGLADAALLVWAVDELARGVNPFRRMLGLLVIIATVTTLAR